MVVGFYCVGWVKLAFSDLEYGGRMSGSRGYS